MASKDIICCKAKPLQSHAKLETHHTPEGDISVSQADVDDIRWKIGEGKVQPSHAACKGSVQKAVLAEKAERGAAMPWKVQEREREEKRGQRHGIQSLIPQIPTPTHTSHACTTPPPLSLTAVSLWWQEVWRKFCSPMHVCACMHMKEAAVRKKKKIPAQTSPSRMHLYLLSLYLHSSSLI